MSDKKQGKQENKDEKEIDMNIRVSEVVKNYSEDDTPEYKEYRRQWEENPKNNVVNEFPIHVDFEAASHCNLRCPFCFQSFNPPPPQLLKLEWFKKVIDEGVPKGLCSIKLQYRGEPLLHPQIAEMVKYAKDKGVIEVMFNTNATLLNEEKARALVKAGLDKIICSVDGYFKEMYERNRVGGKWEIVLENILRLQRIKKEFGSKKPIVRVQMLETKENHPHVKEYIDFWKDKVESVVIEGVVDYYKEYVESKEGKKEQVLICKGFVCDQPWQRMFILSDGRITLCCGDRYQRMVLGNISKDSISDIWTSDRLKKFRELHVKGESHNLPLCAQCDLRTRIIKESFKRAFSEKEYQKGKKKEKAENKEESNKEENKREEKE